MNFHLRLARLANLRIITCCALALISSAPSLWGQVRGFSGPQVLGNVFNPPVTSEPKPCGRSVLGTYWFAFQKSTKTCMNFNTVGSVSSSGNTMDTVLAIYKVNGSGLSYSDLSSYACNDNYGGQVTSSVTATLNANVLYYIQIGINAVPGSVKLNSSEVPCASPTPTPTPY